MFAIFPIPARRMFRRFRISRNYNHENPRFFLARPPNFTIRVQGNCGFPSNKLLNGGIPLWTIFFFNFFDRLRVMNLLKRRGIVSLYIEIFFKEIWFYENEIKYWKYRISCKRSCNKRMKKTLFESCIFAYHD